MILRKEFKGMIAFDETERQYYYIEEQFAKALIEIENTGTTSKQMIDKLLNSGLVSQMGDHYMVLGKKHFSTDVNKGSLVAPIIVFLQITNQCNLKCKHCFTGQRDRKSANELSYQEIQELFAYLSQNGIFEVVIGGGEPFVRKDIIDILRLANSLSITPSITTNGLLINDKVIKELKNIPMGYIKISLDGTQEAHDFIRGPGNYQKSISALKKMIQAGIHVGVRMVINAQNYRDIKPLYQEMADLGCPSISFSFIRPSGNVLANRELFDAFTPHIHHSIIRDLNEIKNANRISVSVSDDVPYIEGLSTGRQVLPELLPSFGCSLKGTVCEIDSEGNIAACGFLRGLLGDSMIAGNIRKDDLLKLWRTAPELTKCRALTSPIECQDCIYQNQCSGGCRTRALYSTGLLTGCDPLCIKAIEKNSNITKSERCL